MGRGLVFLDGIEALAEEYTLQKTRNRGYMMAGCGIGDWHRGWSLGCEMPERDDLEATGWVGI